MTSVHPFSDPLLWVRFLPALAAILFLPGWLLVGRFLVGGSRFDRFLIACVAGLVLVPVVASVLRWAGLPLTPWTFLPLSLLPAYLAGLSRRWAAAISEVDLGGPVGGPESYLLPAVSLLMLVGALVGFADYCVPPDLGDGSNHAFLTARVAAAASTSPESVFAWPWGGRGLPYLPGWHVAAALVARLGGMAPYVAMWMLCILVLCSLPAVLTLLWRRWGVAGPALALAGAFVGANHKIPLGLISWGGYGIIMGTFVVPWSVLLLERTWRGGRLPVAALAGLTLGSLLYIHATEVILALLLTALTLFHRGVCGERPCRRALLFLALGFAFLGTEVMVGLSGKYAVSAIDDATFMMHRFGHTFETFLHAAGAWIPLQILWAVGLVMGLWRREWRPVAVAAVLVGSLAGSLAAFRDPLSLALSTPFYGQAHRVYDVLIYFMAPLMTLPISALMVRTRKVARVGHLVSRAAVLLVVALCLFPAQLSLQGVYRNVRSLAPMDGDDFNLARAMAPLVEEGAWVANQAQDGTFWFWHISGCSFLRPTHWGLGNGQKVRLDRAVAGLVQNPWPDETLALRELDTQYLLVRDPQDHGRRPAAFFRGDVREDERFEAVLQGKNSTLFRIRWSPAESAAR